MIYFRFPETPLVQHLLLQETSMPPNHAFRKLVSLRKVLSVVLRVWSVRQKGIRLW